MCTVTYIPKANKTFILTVSRDEAVNRSTLVPDFYVVDGVKMLYPKDAVAGGSWIGISEKSRLVSLLNGGFEKHIRQENYKMSRGVIVKELLKADDVLQEMHAFDFHGIEPFTVIIIDWDDTLIATQLVWDGSQAHITALDDRPRIWSSSLLYNTQMKGKREEWFSEFGKNADWEAESLLDFHTTAGEGNPHFDLLMDRGVLKTVSVTQVQKTEDTCKMTYHDLQKEEVYETKFELIAFGV